MAVVLLCAKCTDNFTIHNSDLKNPLESVARQNGWIRTSEGWICPGHSKEVLMNPATSVKTAEPVGEAS